MIALLSANLETLMVSRARAVPEAPVPGPPETRREEGEGPRGTPQPPILFPRASPGAALIRKDMVLTTSLHLRKLFTKGCDRNGTSFG